MAHHIACLYRRPVGRRGGYGLRIVRQKRSVAVASQPASQEREFRVGRQRLVDSIAEYASNPAHSDCGPETFGRLLRCPVTAPSGIHFMRCGGLSEVSSTMSGAVSFLISTRGYPAYCIRWTITPSVCVGCLFDLPARYLADLIDALPETQGVFELSGSAERSGGFPRRVSPQKSSLFPERFIFHAPFPALA